MVVLAASYWLLDSLVFSLDVQGFDHWLAQFISGTLSNDWVNHSRVIIAPCRWLVATGYLFGSVLGSLYAYLGNILGSYIAFELARILGSHLSDDL